MRTAAGMSIVALLLLLLVSPEQACGIPASYGASPPSGTFTLHGRPLDILSDGHTLLYVRARYYDPVNGRWLQRDPTGYTDGGNLYESFAGNAVRFVDPSGQWIARRIGELINENGQLTVGDIQRLGEELNSSPAKQLAKLTDEELQLLRLIGGAANGTPWTESTLSSGLRRLADEEFVGLAPPYRYRAQARLSTRRRMLFILLFQNQSFSGYVTDLYRVSRDFNSIHFAAERGIQIGTGVESVTGQEVNRLRAAGEFVVYLALLKGLQSGPKAITNAAGGEVPVGFPAPLDISRPGDAVVTGSIPPRAISALRHIRTTGTAPRGFKGGRQFLNDGRNRGQLLPKTNAQGGRITYKEYDVNPNRPGVTRGKERIVIGSDGRAYYTNDHYRSLVEIP